MDEIQTLKSEKARLQKRLTDEIVNFDTKLDDAMKTWRCLHGQTEEEQQRFEELKIKESQYKPKFEEYQRKIVDLEAKNHFMFQTLDTVYTNHHEKYDRTCYKCN